MVVVLKQPQVADDGEFLIANRYRPLDGEKVRQGGQATVYKAVDTATDQIVAVKLIEGLFREETALMIHEREVQALSGVSHPNIVRLRDSGYDDEGRLYIVLDWVEDSLEAELERRKTIAVGVMIHRYLRPLAGAVAYLHLREQEHRDIKPSNVLLDEHKDPILADFGVGKSHAVQGEGSDRTIQSFRSGIWTPPERHVTVRYVRDVYSLAVLFVKCVSSREVNEYHELADAVKELRIPAPLKDLLLRSVALDPGDRPANASVFANELEAMIREDLRRAPAKVEVPLTLTKKATTQIGGAFGTPAQVRRILQDDLSGKSHVNYQWDREKEDYDTETLILVGESMRLVLKPSESSGLLIVDASGPEFEALEAFRRRALELPPRINWSLEAVATERNGTAILQEHLSRHIATAEGSDEEAGDPLLSKWRKLLGARETLERGERRPMRWISVDTTRGGHRFELETQPDLDLVGTEWQLSAGRSAGMSPRCEIVEQDGDFITVRWASRPPAALAKRGTLEPHLGPSQVSLQRQSDAISSLETGTTAAPWLRALLEDPSTAQPPLPLGEVRWSASLDDDKRDAVAAALGTSQCLVLQGPPGTGKTTFITEYVQRLLEREPKARILIVSQTHVAVDNALTRLERSGVPRLVRLGRPDDSRVDPDVRELLLANQFKRWANGVRERAERTIMQLSSDAGFQISVLRGLSILLTVRSSMRNRRQVSERLSHLPASASTLSTELGLLEDPQALSDRLESARSAERELLREASALLGDELPLTDDAVEADVDAAIDLLSERTAETPQLLEYLRLQSEWLDRVESDASLAAEFLNTASVVAGTCIGFLGTPSIRELEFDVCIVDEASKATSTEALVPIIRSKRFIMIGDLNQLPPMDEDLLLNQEILQQHDLTPADVEETLFQRLSEGLPEANCFRLTRQYRMIQPIGDLISDCFYGGDLVSPRVDGLRGYDALGRVALWLDTAGDGSKRLEVDDPASPGRYVNRLEGELIAGRLRTIEGAVSKGVVSLGSERFLEVLVLAPYRSQVEHLRRRLARERFEHLSVIVETVDAVQGREADLTFFSVTRSNRERRLGFLGEEHWRRINVALSRGRFGLTIVGDSSTCRAGGLARVLSHMRSRPETCEIRVNHG